MSPLSDNPFAALTAIVAPAILTNASSILCLSTGNRFARVMDRTRIVTAELASLGTGSWEHHLQVGQLAGLQLRARLLLRALGIFYATLGSFAVAALISVVGSMLVLYNQQLPFRIAAALGLASGTFGVAGLVYGCMLMVQETRLAVRNITREAELRQRQHTAPS